MAVFKGVSKIRSKVCSDPVGLIQALLNDIPNDGEGLEYDEWLSLVSMLKYEMEDHDLAFEMFDEFSQKSDIYDEGFTYTKFYDADMEGTGDVTLGTLIYLAKRDIPNYSSDNYHKFYNDEHVSAVKVLRKKIKDNKNKMPKHILVDPVEQISVPDIRVEPELAMLNLFVEGETYATATHPANELLVRPYDGDTLHQYITVNPIEEGTSRRQDNVTHFKYSVLEFDTISLDEQWSVLNAVDLPYEAIIFTGGKSLHAWIRIDAPDIETYKKRTRLIGKMFEDFGYTKKNGNKVDTAVLYDCASWVRCPGVSREAIKSGDEHTTGVEQKVLWTEPSTGWEFWYDNVYPQYVVESSLEEVEEEAPKHFEVPEKNKNFSRKLTKLKDSLGDNFLEELAEAMEGLEEDNVKEFLDEAAAGFFQTVRKQTKLILEVSDMYHVLIDTVLESGCPYDGDIREALLDSCYISVKFEENRKKEAIERLTELLEGEISVNSEWTDPKILEEVNRGLEKAMDGKEEEFEKMASSVLRMFEKINFRSSIYQDPEMYKYAKQAGKFINDFTDGVEDTDKFFSFRQEVSKYNPTAGTMDKITVGTFASLVAPYICFVKRNKSEFNVVPLDNDSTNKLLSAHQFQNTLRELDFLSDVPIFDPDSAELIYGYNDNRRCLVTGDSEGYELLPISEAKEIILDLFSDFKFVSQADLSRAVGCLIMPAMCHAGMLNGDSRPLTYVDADGQGAGKGTLMKFLVYPYSDKTPFVAQDDSSIGSIDEKIGLTIRDGHNQIVLDNLKPTRRMKEFSSPFVESMLTTDRIIFRSAGDRGCNLDLKHTTLYITTNGMPLSKDLAERAFFISIRKQDYGYKHKHYNGGLDNYLIENRPRIMSAIYSVLKEYVDHGSPTKTPVEGHRFLYSVPVLNYIVTEIFGLEDITRGTRERKIQRTGKETALVRAICFSAEKSSLLGDPLNNLDIFEILEDNSSEDVLGLPSDLEIWSDENCTQMTQEAKRKIGMTVSKALSNKSLLGKPTSKREESSCSIEEFQIKRFYDPKTQQPRYVVTK